MINVVTLVGRAGKDPQIRNFDNGNKIAEVSIALSRRVKDKDQTDWVDVKIWGKAAEVAEKYIRKGHLFGVTGELQQEKWEKDGNKFSKLVVSSSQLKLMQPKDKDKEPSVPASAYDEEPGF